MQAYEIGILTAVLRRTLGLDAIPSRQVVHPTKSQKAIFGHIEPEIRKTARSIIY
jgi:hypothetical protein